MEGTFDVLRDKIKNISFVEPYSLIEILLNIVDEIEAINMEIRQGWTKV